MRERRSKGASGVRTAASSKPVGAEEGAGTTVGNVALGRGAVVGEAAAATLLFGAGFFAAGRPAGAAARRDVEPTAARASTRP